MGKDVLQNALAGFVYIGKTPRMSINGFFEPNRGPVSTQTRFNSSAYGPATRPSSLISIALSVSCVVIHSMISIRQLPYQNQRRQFLYCFRLKIKRFSYLRKNLRTQLSARRLKALTKFRHRDDTHRDFRGAVGTICLAERGVIHLRIPYISSNLLCWGSQSRPMKQHQLMVLERTCNPSDDFTRSADELADFFLFSDLFLYTIDQPIYLSIYLFIYLFQC